MIIRKNFRYSVVSVLLMVLAGGAQAEEVTGSISRTGDIDLRDGESPANGNLRVEGQARLAMNAENLMGKLAPELGLQSAEYYGPVTIGKRTTIAEFVYVKSGDHTSGDFVNIPIGKIGVTAVTEVTITIDEGGGAGGPSEGVAGAGMNHEFARWTLASGGRHVKNENEAIPALSHFAYGAGHSVKLEATKAHGNTFLRFSYDYNHGDGSQREHWITVRIVSTSNTEVDPQNSDEDYLFSGGSKIGITPTLEIPVESIYNYYEVKPTESTIFERSLVSNQGNNQQYRVGGFLWTDIRKEFDVRTFQVSATNKIELNGNVILTAPQGDIGVGIYE